MVGFLKALQSNMSLKWEGRYFALMLWELSRVQPHAFCSAFKNAPSVHLQLKKRVTSGDFKAETEWMFPWAESNQKRRADLIVKGRKGTPFLLAEVKEEDGRKSNSAQIEDYIRFIRQNEGCCFVLITRYPLHQSDRAALEIGVRDCPGRCYHLTYSSIASSLKHHNQHSSGAAALVFEYLRDHNMTYEDKIDYEAPMRALAKSMLGISEGTGRLATASTMASVPKLTEDMLGNVTSVGDWLQTSSSDWFIQRFRSNMGSEVWLDPQLVVKVAKGAIKDEEESLTLTKLIQANQGGEIWFGASAVSRKEPKVWLWLFFSFEVERLAAKAGPRMMITPSLGVTIWSNTGGLRQREDSFQVVKRLPDELQARAMFRKLIMRTVEKVKAEHGLKYKHLDDLISRLT